MLEYAHESPGKITSSRPKVVSIIKYLCGKTTSGIGKKRLQIGDITGDRMIKSIFIRNMRQRTATLVILLVV